MPLNNSPTPSSCQHEKDPLDGDAVTEDDNDCKDVIKENIVDLPPVLAFSSGEGLPYAPEGWPSPDDVWGWKVGRRVNKAGYFHDRYLYLPKSLQRPRKSWSFQSKLEVIRYIQSNFPNMKIEAFFALFSWQVLSAEQSHAKGNVLPIAAVPLQQFVQPEESDSDCGADVVWCKARNKKCDSLVLEEVEKHLPAMMPCDVCCSEPGFCRDCCCILCCKTVTSAYGGYSYIKCPVNNGAGICSHLAHMECALRACMAGTVGGSIGLDAEYHCRRCDGRTDLIAHVNNLLQTCKAADMDDEIRKKILNLGACLLRGSHKPVAKKLLRHIELAISKLKMEISLDDIWKVDDKLVANSAGLSAHGNGIDESPLDVRMAVESYDHLPRSLKLEAEVDQVLEALKKSQEFEYKLAEEKLQEHKTYLQKLYDQLDYEKSELACRNSSGSDVLFNAVRKRKAQIRREMRKFEAMKKVAIGFGSTPKDILEELFDLDTTD